MTQYIAEFKHQKKYMVDIHDDTYIFSSDDGHDSFECNASEYELIKKLFHVTEPRKRYAKSTFRSKLLDLSPKLKDLSTTVYSEARVKKFPRPSLFHISVFFTYEQINQLKSIINKNIASSNICYVLMRNSLLDINNFNTSFDNNIEDVIARINSGKLQSYTFCVNIGFDTLKLFNQLTLLNLRISSDVAIDYSRYKNLNYIADKINSEMEGTY